MPGTSHGRPTRLPPTRLRAMGPAELQAYAELSGDRNPIHLDREQALLAGHPDLICHGMLAMTDIGGWLVRAMAGWQLVTLTTRFVAPMVVGTRLKVSASCEEHQQSGEAPRATVDVVAEDAGGVVRVKGRAIFQRPIRFR
jgi:acyl dehydratase